MYSPSKNEITYTDYQEEDAGQTIKASKKKYIWTFLFQQRQHSVQVHHSSMSGKIRIF